MANAIKHRYIQTGIREVDRQMQNMIDIINDLENRVIERTATITNVIGGGGGSGTPTSTTGNIVKSFDNSSFPGSDAILGIPSNRLLKKIYLTIITAFDTGTLQISDGSGILVTTDENFLTEAGLGAAQEFLIGKQYLSPDNITLTYGGSPSTGSAKIIFDLVEI